MTFPWLTAALLLPIIGAVVVMAMPKQGTTARLTALGFSVATFVLSIAVALIFFLVLDELVLGIVFAVVALVAAAVTVYAFVRRRRGQQ